VKVPAIGVRGQAGAGTLAMADACARCDTARFGSSAHPAVNQMEYQGSRQELLPGYPMARCMQTGASLAGQKVGAGGTALQTTRRQTENGAMETAPFG